MGKPNNGHNNFKNTYGFGILAKSGEKEKVDAAVCSHPHFIDDGTISLIIRDRLAHINLESNPHACFMFIK